MVNNPLEQNDRPQVLKSLPRPQKIAVIILALLALIIIIFWALQFKARLSSPFNTDSGNTSGSATSTVSMSQDSDGDGLTDLEEINTYHTSPYLEDTDSDGILDKKEVDQGTDPNCPKGQDCNTTETTTNNSGADSSAANQAPNTQTTASGVNSPAAASGTAVDVSQLNQTDLQNALNGQADAATIRQLLIQSGASAAELNQISDEDLMKSYQETLKNQNQ